MLPLQATRDCEPLSPISSVPCPLCLHPWYPVLMAKKIMKKVVKSILKSVKPLKSPTVKSTLKKGLVKSLLKMAQRPGSKPESKLKGKDGVVIYSRTSSKTNEKKAGSSKCRSGHVTVDSSNGGVESSNGGVDSSNGGAYRGRAHPATTKIQWTLCRAQSTYVQGRHESMLWASDDMHVCAPLSLSSP